MDGADWARKRFVEAVETPAPDVRLDVAALCIAARIRPALDIEAELARLDDLARGCEPATFDGMRANLFDKLGFTGNTHDYADPENSFLDSVITRRTGIPISLSVLTMEVGRRLGLTVEGVGMPGHFLVHDAGRPGVWCDPFNGGALHDLEGCRSLFQRVHGGAHGFHPAFLAASTPHEILARMLANLEHGRLARDPLQLAWLCELHRAIPGIGEEEQRRLDLTLRSSRARWN
jgi:regulator of sirC expression with transglutaminase-like and TPR domain